MTGTLPAPALPRKTAIAARFDAAEDYDSAAALQKRCALALARHIRHRYPDPSAPLHVLEFGCGTGFLSRELVTALPRARFLLTDLAPAMLERTRHRLASGPAFPADRLAFALMDGEAPDLPPGMAGGFDLITSSLCLQWFANRRHAFAALVKLLRPGGRLMVSTLAAGSLRQWQESCAATHTPCGVPDYPTLALLRDDWPHGAGNGHWEEELMEDPTPSARHFLRGLRNIGASLPRSGHRPAPDLRQAMRHFDARFHNVTYHIAFGCFCKAN